MEITTFMQFPYPDDGQDPFYDAYQTQMQALDEAAFMSKIQNNLIIGGGGAVALNSSTGVLTWTGDFVVPVFHFGKKITVSFGPDGPIRACGLPDGSALVLEIPFTMADNVVLNFSVLTQLTPLNHQQWIAGLRLGSKVYFKGMVV